MGTKQDERLIDARIYSALNPRITRGERVVKMVNLRHWLRRLLNQGCLKHNNVLNGPCLHGGSFLKGTHSGFTMIEILIVVVILAIAAMMAVPMISSASSMQLRSAANMIAADLEYAKSMAISRQKIYKVVFDTTAESYRIEDPNGIIMHPVKKGFQYVVDFSGDSRLSQVDIDNVNFDTTGEVKFDYLGSPLNGNDGYLNSGVISLKTPDGVTSTITVEPVTGFVLIAQ